MYWPLGGSELCLTYATSYVKAEVCLSGGSIPSIESTVVQKETAINQPENKDGDKPMVMRNRSILRKIKKSFAIVLLGVSIGQAHLITNMHSKKAA